ncbi:hypothetical protein N7532_006225 [Penicillium argentinense]|uniref:Uncharacterized protein n=1 Tax=Penicillium argentinense TaxID=1131581 RepID=A0A9W9KAJ6_9EURO|nr:uncharacterized protein N7532_006225 [Penicillium argentinense]KAJ5099224.1 hypothetical protein N7532_006225 [Penicillium argentinense]
MTESRAIEVSFYESVWGNEGSLRDFTALKRLSLSINFLLYFTTEVKSGLGEFGEDEKNLTRNVSVGGMSRQHADWDEQVDALIAAIEEGIFPHLKEVTGVDRKIPSSIHGTHQDRYATIWSLSENGYETDGVIEARERGDVDYTTGEKAFSKHMNSDIFSSANEPK